MPIRNQLTARGMCRLVRMRKGNQHVSKQFSMSSYGEKQAKLWIERKMKEGYSLW